MKENIMVIGGTGKTGRRIVSRLQDQGYSVRIGSRSGTPPFDWQQPDTWVDALSGMKKAYISYQPDLAMPGALETIEKLTQVAQAKKDVTQHAARKEYMLGITKGMASILGVIDAPNTRPNYTLWWAIGICILVLVFVGLIMNRRG